MGNIVPTVIYFYIKFYKYFYMSVGPSVHLSFDPLRIFSGKLERGLLTLY